MIDEHSLPTTLQKSTLFLSALLLFVWPLPGTIALRHLLMVLVLGTVIVGGVNKSQGGWKDLFQSYRKLLIPLGAFILWMIIGAVFWSPERSWSTSEISGQWIRPLIALFLGIGVSSTLAQCSFFRMDRQHNPLIFFGLILSVQLIAHWADVLSGLFLSDIPIIKTSRFFGTRLTVSYLTNTLAAIVMAYILCISLKATKVTRPLLLAASIASSLVIATTIVLDTRNGYVGLITLLLASCTFLLLARSKVQRKFFLIAIIIIASLIVTTFRVDKRWQAFKETAYIALDIEGNHNWKDYNETGKLPVLASGKTVDESAYLRIASLRTSLSLATEFPFGYGFGRNVFGHASKAVYGKGIGNSHSGLCDVLVGTGYFGLVLWLTFLAGFLIAAIQQIKTKITPGAVAVFFLVSGYLGRSFIDSNIRDYPLEMFMFTLGLISLETVKEIARSGACKAIDSSCRT